MTVFKQVILNGSVLKEHPFLREFELQGYLIAHPELLSLAESDEQFEVNEVIGVERTLKNGRIDMVVEYRSGQIAIVELKRGDVRRKDLDQLRGYLDNLNETKKWKVFKEYKQVNDAFDEAVSTDNVFGVLVGRNISKEVEEELEKKSKHIINTLIVKRYMTDSCEYLVTEASTHFSSRDHQKYRVNGLGPFGKGRMVLEAIRAFVSQNRDVSYNELTSDKFFPSTLRGPQRKWGCVALLNEARQLVARSGHKRHYLDPEDVITLKDNRKIVVSSQWGIGIIDKFIHRATELGVRIETIKSDSKESKRLTSKKHHET